MKDRVYEERLTALKLDSLEKIKLTYDIVEVYKIVDGLYAVDFAKLFSYQVSAYHTRSHHSSFKSNSLTMIFENSFFPIAL